MIRVANLLINLLLDALLFNFFRLLVIQQILWLRLRLRINILQFRLICYKLLISWLLLMIFLLVVTCIVNTIFLAIFLIKLRIWLALAWHNILVRTHDVVLDLVAILHISLLALSKSKQRFLFRKTWLILSHAVNHLTINLNLGLNINKVFPLS